MLDLLKFDITAVDRTAAAFDRVKSELGGVKGALAGVNDYARRAGRSMRNMGVGLSAAVTTPLALIGKQSVQLYDTQVRAEKAVEQAILSTGGAAGKTAAELKGLAGALQGVTTFGDEDILQNVTAPLLTFTKVQGQTFDRAQANVLDMATLLKMDLKSASILVGKALNDPVKGISALSRSGVQFSEAQKKVIKSLVETGDVAGAQALILDELETQFKGQAAAAASAPLGQWKQLSNAIGDVKEQLGAEIVPFLKPLVESVKEGVAWFSQLSPEVKKNIVVFGGLAAAVGPALAILGAATLGVGTLATAFTGLGAALLANPVLAIIAAVAGGAYLIYRNWDGIRAWFGGVWDGLKSRAASGWSSIKTTLDEFAPQWIKDAWTGIEVWFDNTLASVQTSFSIAWSGIKGLLSASYSPEQLVYSAWRGIGQWFRDLGPDLTAAFGELWEAIKTEVSLWPGRMIQHGKDLIDGLVQGIKFSHDAPAKALRGAIRRGIDASEDEADSHSPSRVFMGIGKDLMDGLAIGIERNAGTALEEMRAVTQTLVAEGTRSTGFLESFRDGAKSIFTSVLTGAQSFKGALSGVLSGFGNRLIGGALDSIFDAVWPFAKGGVVSGGRVTPFASGGIVSGATAFPMAGGIGLMGEAGPEAIMPLTRGPDGKLGVRAQGGGRGDTLVFRFAPVVDARGADQAAVARLEAALVEMHRGFEGRVHQTLRAGRNRGLNRQWSGT